MAGNSKKRGNDKTSVTAAGLAASQSMYLKRVVVRKGLLRPREEVVKKTDIPAKIKKLLEPCRFLDKETKNLFMPLVELATKQHHEIKDLEQKIRELQQPKIFTSLYEEGSAVSKSFPKYEKIEGGTRNERIWKHIKEGTQESESFNLLLKWNKLTLSEAYEIFSEHELFLKQSVDS